MSVNPDVATRLYDALKECLRNSDKEGAIEIYDELLRLGCSVREILNAIDRIPSNSEHTEIATAEHSNSEFNRVAPGVISETAWVSAAQINAQRTSGLCVPHIAEGCKTEQPQAAKNTPLNELGPDDWEQLPRESVPGSERGIVEAAGAHTSTSCEGTIHCGNQKRLWPGNLPSTAKRIAFGALYMAAIASASIAGFSIVHGSRDAEPTSTGIQSEISNGTEAPAIPGSVIGRSNALAELLLSKDQVGNPDPSHAPKPLQPPEPDPPVSAPAQKAETGVRDAVFAGQPEAETSQKSETGQLDSIEQLIEQLNHAAAASPNPAHEPISLVAQWPSAAPIESAETELHLDTAPPDASESLKATPKDEAKAIETVSTENVSAALPSRTHASKRRRVHILYGYAGSRQSVSRQPPARYPQPVYNEPSPGSYNINPASAPGYGYGELASYSDTGD
jgi:hypothetical protein